MKKAKARKTAKPVRKAAPSRKKSTKKQSKVRTARRASATAKSPVKLGVTRPYREALALVQLKKQIDAAVPNRSRVSDGWIGDAAHASRTSDHNPYIVDKKGYGVVRARDFTHDPKNGMDSYVLAENLRQSGDKRISYIISNGRIANPGKPWRAYHGSNPHDHHVHVSVVESPALYDSEAPWKIGSLAHVPTPGDRPVQPVPDDPVLRRGSKGEKVAELQRMLGITADSDFGPATERAVKAFQTQRSLVSDGVVGPATWRALRAAKASASATTALNFLPPAPSNFDRVMEYVLDDEGGLTIHSDEPGGASNMGISLQTLERARGRDQTLDDLKALSVEDAKSIYRSLYWDAIGADKLPAGLSYAAFDFAVNSGTSVVDQIGIDDFLSEALKQPTVERQIDRLCDLRLEYMQRDPKKWSRYQRGWSARVARVRSRAKTLAS